MTKASFETVSAEEFGARLRGFGVNILVQDVARELAFLERLFGAVSHQATEDFAIVTIGSVIMQIHHDRTYHDNSLLSLLPENPPRGAGIELRLYDVDPEKAFRAAFPEEVLAEPMDKPHGLREAVFLSPSGYAWLPSRAL